MHRFNSDGRELNNYFRFIIILKAGVELATGSLTDVVITLCGTCWPFLCTDSLQRLLEKLKPRPLALQPLLSSRNLLQSRK